VWQCKFQCCAGASLFQGWQRNGPFVLSDQPEVIAQPVNGVLEAAAGWRFGRQGQRSKVLVDLVVANLLGQPAEMKAYQGDAPDVVFQRTAALSPEGNLLLQQFVHFFKTINTLDGFFHQSGFCPFSHKALFVKFIMPKS